MNEKSQQDQAPLFCLPSKVREYLKNRIYGYKDFIFFHCVDINPLIQQSISEHLYSFQPFLAFKQYYSKY